MTCPDCGKGHTNDLSSDSHNQYGEGQVNVKTIHCEDCNKLFKVVSEVQYVERLGEMEL